MERRNNLWASELQQHTMEPHEGKYAHALELWRWYYEEAERFDRTVCTGPVVHGGIMPATYEEGALIREHARRLIDDVGWWVSRLGVSLEISSKLRREARGHG